jgi:hypothetical protein
MPTEAAQLGNEVWVSVTKGITARFCPTHPTVCVQGTPRQP